MVKCERCGAPAAWLCTYDAAGPGDHPRAPPFKCPHGANCVHPECWPENRVEPLFNADYLTCEICGADDDETTSGQVDVEGNDVNVCETCLAKWTI